MERERATVSSRCKPPKSRVPVFRSFVDSLTAKGGGRCCCWKPLFDDRSLQCLPVVSFIRKGGGGSVGLCFPQTRACVFFVVGSGNQFDRTRQSDDVFRSRKGLPILFILPAPPSPPLSGRHTCTPTTCTQGRVRWCVGVPFHHILLLFFAAYSRAAAALQVACTTQPVSSFPGCALSIAVCPLKKNTVWRYSNECTADETDRPNPLLYRNANERPFSLTLPVDSAARAIRTFFSG